jgi:hypothetical protein
VRIQAHSVAGFYSGRRTRYRAFGKRVLPKVEYGQPICRSVRHDAIIDDHGMGDAQE